MRPGSRIFSIVETLDERDPLAERGIELIEATFDRRDRQPIEELRSEIEEKRRGLPTTQEYHMLLAMADARDVVGAITGMYLAGVNAGFVTYLAVREGYRRHGLGRRLRSNLVAGFRADSQLAGRAGKLGWVLGEVRRSSPWLRRLVRKRGAVPFDLEYYHPGVRPPARPLHVLYRQPIDDARVELPVPLVRRILYAIYRRGYRVRYPLLHAGFREMMVQLEDRSAVGMHPRFRALAENRSGGSP